MYLFMYLIGIFAITLLIIEHYKTALLCFNNVKLMIKTTIHCVSDIVS